jgi:protein involved in polysaccharide export with SLBB domain
MTAYSSTRDIEVVPAAGEASRYDLFLSSRIGGRELDPYVGPQDTVVVHRRSREVTVVGEVERPGSFQLLPGEELEELLRLYGAGYTRLADAAHTQITRWDVEKNAIAETLYVDASQSARVELKDLDVVRVPSVKQRLPVAFFEGAIASAEGQSNVGVDTFARITYTFAQGELLSSAVTALYARFGAGSDIDQAFVVRSDTEERIPVDIRRLVQDYDPATDLPLRPFDRIVIPFRKFVVTVSGAVARPGQYPYLPNRSWRYYVELAGGFDPEKHVGKAVIISDFSDKSQPGSRIIEPEDKILAPTNSPFYHAAPIVQVVGVLASVTTAIVAVIQLLR